MNQQPNLIACAIKRAKPSDRLLELVKHHSNSVPSRGTVTLQFKDTCYNPTEGGFHPVSIVADIQDSNITIIQITDLAYAGSPHAELMPDLAFDFANQTAFARFSGWLGMHLEEVTELYAMWEGNFLAYVDMDAFDDISAHVRKVEKLA
ncbi:TPA: DUF2787 family protein [Vibrio parahaemolyticus]|nr:DUF2787 family protein [Vibrio parahaemolyticus]